MSVCVCVCLSVRVPFMHLDTLGPNTLKFNMMILREAVKAILKIVISNMPIVKIRKINISDNGLPIRLIFGMGVP
jgi:hypothetical protein